MKCPGQENPKLTSSLHPCRQCGYRVEMFSDELRIKCPKCRAEVVKEQAPSCLQWCSAAKQCIGEERWKLLFGDSDRAGCEAIKK